MSLTENCSVGDSNTCAQADIVSRFIVGDLLFETQCLMFIVSICIVSICIVSICIVSICIVSMFIVSTLTVVRFIFVTYIQLTCRPNQMSTLTEHRRPTPHIPRSRIIKSLTFLTNEIPKTMRICIRYLIHSMHCQHRGSLGFRFFLNLCKPYTLKMSSLVK